jgi:hypothetical protein
MARELISPTRIWSLRLELALAGGQHREVALVDWHQAGTSSEWLDDARASVPLERAAFVGEVWGQRRAWTAEPSDAQALRVAGALATQASLGGPRALGGGEAQKPAGLSAAARTALAYHAQVVSPFTSAWALASFSGPAAAPSLRAGIGGFGGRGVSFGCGGAHGSGFGRMSPTATIEQLTQQVLASCPDAKPGTLVFETIDLEIVDVVTDDPCLREQTWALDIWQTNSSGRRLITVEHGGSIEFDERVLGYLDLTMPTPNNTTNTASGMK